MNWISVKDRLPSTNRYVGIKTNLKQVYNNWYTCSWTGLMYNHKRSKLLPFSKYSFTGITSNEYVTHWCEITEPNP